MLELAVDAGAPSGARDAQNLGQYYGGAFDDGGVDDFEIDEAAGLPLEPTRSVDEGPWPSGLTPPRTELAIPAAEVSRVAGYGPPGPTALAPLYAYRVFVRQLELKRKLSECEASLEDAERERSDLLKHMVQSRREQIEQNERIGRLLEPLRRVETVAQQRQLDLGRVHEELGTELAVFDQRLSELSDRRTAEQQKADAHGEQLAAAQQRHGRAFAKLKRAQIEVRNQEQRIREAVGPEGGLVPGDLAASLRALQQKGRSLEPNAEQAVQALVAAR
jgi:hypothetical protein